VLNVKSNYTHIDLVTLVRTANTTLAVCDSCRNSVCLTIEKLNIENGVGLLSFDIARK